MISYCFFSFKTLDYSEFFTNFAGKFNKKIRNKKNQQQKTEITTLNANQRNDIVLMPGNSLRLTPASNYKHQLTIGGATADSLGI